MTKIRTNRVMSLLTAIVMVLSLSSFFCISTAFADYDGDWRFTVSNNKATITAYTGTEKAIVVPALVGGYSVGSVTGLCTSSTSKAKITSITFSDGISELAPSLCANYTALKSVKLPSGLKVLGSNAFQSCTSLANITLPSSVTEIGSSAFQGCTSLATADLSCKATAIPTSLFSNCSKLVSVTLPSGCTSIGGSAFNDCVKLSKITLPDTITSIGDSAFSGCVSLSGDMALPASLKTIGNAAFYGCTGITEVKVPNKVKTIGSEAFGSCTAVKYIYIGNGVTKIGDNAFGNCVSLNKLIFGGSYVTLSEVFDIDNVPVVYYPSSYQSKWVKYSGTKASYADTTSVKLSGSKTLTAGSSLKLTTTIKPANSIVGNLCYYSSSDPSVATVDANGVVTALKGGKVTITATSITGKSGSVTVNTVPKKVTGLKATSATANSVKLSWNVSSGVAGYYVYRSTSATTGFKKIATVATNSYTDKGLTKGTKYYYSIRAYVKVGTATHQSSLCNSKGITATSPAPASVKATKYSSGVARLSWSKCVGAEGYQIAYSTSANGTYKSAGYITSGSTLSGRKTGLTAGKTYYFKVRSYITVNGKKVYSAFSTTVRVKV